jgi:calcineurin-like phosphoesterase family protein
MYFIADTHFFHQNIIEYCNRPFSSVDEMNQTLISNWNSVVKNKDDIVYFLGDFSFYTTEEKLKWLFSQLNGKIRFIVGNHDRLAQKKLRNYVEFVKKCEIIRYNDKNIMLVHYPIFLEKYRDFCITCAPPILDVVFYAHVHDKLPKNEPDNFVCLSVEQWNYRPVTIEEICQKKQKIGELLCP